MTPPRSHLSPRRAVRLLLTRPGNLADSQRETAERISSACPEMTALASLIGSFAVMLHPDPANEGKLLQCMANARAADLPNLHSFTRGLDLDIKAATAALLYALPLLLLGDGTGAIANLAAVFGWAFAIWGVGLYWWAGILYAFQVRRLMATTPRVTP